MITVASFWRIPGILLECITVDGMHSWFLNCGKQIVETTLAMLSAKATTPRATADFPTFLARLGLANARLSAPHRVSTQLFTAAATGCGFKAHDYRSLLAFHLPFALYNLPSVSRELLAMLDAAHVLSHLVSFGDTACAPLPQRVAALTASVAYFNAKMDDLIDAILYADAVHQGGAGVEHKSGYPAGVDRDPLKHTADWLKKTAYGDKHFTLTFANHKICHLPDVLDWFGTLKHYSSWQGASAVVLAAACFMLGMQSFSFAHQNLFATSLHVQAKPGSARSRPLTYVDSRWFVVGNRPCRVFSMINHLGRFCFPVLMQYDARTLGALLAKNLAHEMVLVNLADSRWAATAADDTTNRSTNFGAGRFGNTGHEDHSTSRAVPIASPYAAHRLDDLPRSLVAAFLFNRPPQDASEVRIAVKYRGTLRLLDNAAEHQAVLAAVYGHHAAEAPAAHGRVLHAAYRPLEEGGAARPSRFGHHNLAKREGFELGGVTYTTTMGKSDGGSYVAAQLLLNELSATPRVPRTLEVFAVCRGLGAVGGRGGRMATHGCMRRCPRSPWRRLSVRTRQRWWSGRRRCGSATWPAAASAARAPRASPAARFTTRYLRHHKSIIYPACLIMRCCATLVLTRWCTVQIGDEQHFTHDLVKTASWPKADPSAADRTFTAGHTTVMLPTGTMHGGGWTCESFWYLLFMLAPLRQTEKHPADKPLYLHTRCITFPVELVGRWSRTHDAKLSASTAVVVGLSVADMSFTTPQGQTIIEPVYKYKTAT